jgi:hypothetical protein
VAIAVDIDRLARHELHGEVGMAVRGGAGIDESCNAGMIERSKDTLLVQEPLPVLAIESVAKHFDRDFAVRLSLFVDGAVHRTHPTAADFANQPKTAYPLYSGHCAPRGQSAVYPN